jgi:hypothetical protein
MLRTLFLILLILLAFGYIRRGHAATPDAEALLKHSDQYRNGWPSYFVHVKITSYESGKSDEERLYDVSQKGTDRTYVEFMSPRDKGRHLLAGPHHAAGTALWRRLQWRHCPHQLCRRLLAGLSPHGEGGRGTVLCA